VKVARIAVDAAPPTAPKDPKEALGRVLVASVTVNEPLLPTKFAATERAFTVFAIGGQLQPGSPNYRVMTITVPDNFAVGGIPVPGDTVDIMYVFSFDPAVRLAQQAGANPATQRTTQDTVAKVILGPMRILSRTATVYTIRVDAALAERIAYIQAAGSTLRLLLRAPQDDRVVTTTGATFQTVFQQFRSPIPERVQPQAYGRRSRPRSAIARAASKAVRTCVRVASRSAPFSMTTVAALRNSSSLRWCRRRASASARAIPRSRSRSNMTSLGASTTQISSYVPRSGESSSLIASTTRIASSGSIDRASRTRATTRGWMIRSSCCSFAGSAKTSAASFARSISRSSPSTCVPNCWTIAL